MQVAKWLVAKLQDNAQVETQVQSTAGSWCFVRRSLLNRIETLVVSSQESQVQSQVLGSLCLVELC